MPAVGGLDPGEAVRMVLMKLRAPAVRYPATVRSDDGTHVVVEATWTMEPRDLGFTRFEPGDRFTEHYWRDRWYSVKEVRTATGVLKGWYCDVARPLRVHNGELISEDLDLDLWVSADGATVKRLDEDEFASRSMEERDTAGHSQAMRALAELERLAGERFRGLERRGSL
jgi:uncharacterized protein DUF402